MLANVNFSCGHAAQVKLSDNKEEREKKIAELEVTGLCPECRKAQYEKEDKENAKTGICTRMKREKFEKEFPECKERLTGFPKEKDYTYVFIPAEVVCAEAIRKLIVMYNINFDEAVAKTEEMFSQKYPELYQKLKPIPLDDDDDLYSDSVMKQPVKEPEAPQTAEKEDNSSTSAANESVIDEPAAAAAEPEPEVINNETDTEDAELQEVIEEDVTADINELFKEFDEDEPEQEHTIADLSPVETDDDDDNNEELTSFLNSLNG